MYLKNLLIVLNLIVIFSLVNSITIDDGDGDSDGDVSISPSRQFMKKRIVSQSFLQEQNLVQNLEITKSILNSTTTAIPTTSRQPYQPYRYYPTKQDESARHYAAKQDEKTKNDSPKPNDLERKMKMHKIKTEQNQKTTPENNHEMVDVVTYGSPDSDEEQDNNPFYNYPVYNNPFNNRNYPHRSQPMKLIESPKENKKIYYRVGIIDLPDHSIIDNEVYPIVRFVNQYNCDLNISTCGLYNAHDFKNKFNLDYIQDVNIKQRCLVADTDRSKAVNEYGARLVTQYFHLFGLKDACLEIRHFANGLVKMLRIDQQDEETENIWERNDLRFNNDLNFNQIRNLRVPISLRSSSPRFFITVLLDRKEFGRIGIVGLNFTYDKCSDLV